VPGEKGAGKGEKAEVPWGKTIGGWRMRVTMPAGNEYRRNAPLPLHVELQNATDSPLSLTMLFWQLDAHMTENGVRNIVRPLIDVLPWGGTPR
jgi:hypothetical protein